ncbi:MAG: DUF1028 domain-containing protein [Saprospiraceae bacterium]
MAQRILIFILPLIFISTLPLLHAQDTFSIVAVDPETGEVGSAGASCVVGAASIGGVIIISGIIPGKGAINGQATICIPHTNLNLGMAQMQNGLSPQEILDYLYQNDACQFGNENNRQYGVVDFDDNDMPRAAAFTGSSALDYAGHRVGDNYAIQGNILLGPQILDSIEARFLNTEGPLAVKLMSAIQGANVPGADTRCLDAGTSSTSAFLRVARPGDEANNLYLELNILEEPSGVEPINSLQAAFDAWADTALVSKTTYLDKEYRGRFFPNPAKDQLYFEWEGEATEGLVAHFYTPASQLIYKMPINKGVNPISMSQEILSQLIFVKIVDRSGKIVFTDKILLSRS